MPTAAYFFRHTFIVDTGGAVQVSKPNTALNVGGFGGWTICTGQCAGTPRQLVYTGLGCAAFAAPLVLPAARWAIGWPRPADGRAGCCTVPDCLVVAAPAGAARSELRICSMTA